MKKLNREYAAFDIGDDFILEIIGDDRRTEYYISHEAFRVKSMLFGADAPFEKCVTELQHGMVDADYSEEKEIYRQQYMDN